MSGTEKAPGSTAPSSTEREEFFVGYLPMPKRLRRFHLVVVPGLVLLVLGCAALLAHTMTPVQAHFRSENAMLTGLFRARPAPILWVYDAGQPTHARGILLVQGGKFGLSERLLEELDDHTLRVGGTLLERSELSMLELAAPPLEHTMEDAQLAPLVDLVEVPRGHVRLRGELVDSKCWLGRMRPGVGRTHRACAQQCVAGGIPPIFVTRDAQGEEVGYVLANLSDSTLNSILPLLADSVEAEGELFSVGSLWMLRLDPATLRRL